MVREQVVAIDAQAWFKSHPHDRLDAAEAQSAVQGLPAELREVVTLRLWSGLTLSEIADVTGVVTSTVHKRYEAAIESLRQILEKPCRTQNT